MKGPTLLGFGDGQRPGRLILETELQAIRALVERALAANQVTDWIDQYRSPLRLPGQKSSKRHCQLVRERIARLGPDRGAYISPDEKQFFLTPQAMAEEMSHSGHVPLAKAPALEPESTLDEEEEAYTRVLAIVRRR